MRQLVSDTAVFLAVAVGVVFVLSVWRYLMLRRVTVRIGQTRPQALFFLSFMLASLFVVLVSSFLRTRPLFGQLFSGGVFDVILLISRAGMCIGLFGLVRTWTKDSHGESQWLSLLAVSLVLGTLCLMLIN